MRRGEKRRGSSCLPDNLDEFTHVDVVWHQELGLVQDGELFFSLIPLYDHLQETNNIPFLAKTVLRANSEADDGTH